LAPDNLTEFNCCCIIVVQSNRVEQQFIKHVSEARAYNKNNTKHEKECNAIKQLQNMNTTKQWRNV